MLVQSNIGLEEELRKANAAKGQLETYKRQVRWWVVAIVVCVKCKVFVTPVLSPTGGGTPEQAV